MTGIFAGPAEANEAILEAYREEFNRSEERWKGLEAKAQGTITISGIFTAFALNFAKEIPPEAPRGLIVLTFAAIVMLAGAVILAALSLRIVAVLEPPGGAFVAQYGDDFQKILPEADRAEFITVSWPAIRGKWQNAIDARSKKNGVKATLVLYAQALLLVAILLAAGIACITVVRSAGRIPTPTGATIYEMRSM